MATLIKRKNKWFYSHKEYRKEYRTDNEFSGIVQAFAGTVDKVPEGWLLCDGAEYSIAAYPDLYSAIGNTYGGTTGSTFMVPDYRECVPVGAGQNTTDSISAHDTYDIGQFKDDQLQQMTGQLEIGNSSRQLGGNPIRSIGGSFYASAAGQYAFGSDATSGGVRYYSFDTALVARTGVVNRGKQIGMNYIIHV